MGLIQKIKDFNKSHHKKIRKYKFYLKLILLLLLVLLLLYIIERYIIYNLIYFLLYIIFEKIVKLILFKNFNIFSIKSESIILSFFLHIIIARIIIISIIFLQGGIFKKIIVYEQFLVFINSLRSYIDSAVEYLNNNDEESFKYFMMKLEIFRKCYFNNKSKKSSFVVKNYTLDDELNDMKDKYNELEKNNDTTTKNKLIDSINILSKKMEYYFNFSIIEQLFIFKYKETLTLMEEYMMNSFDNHIVEKVNIKKGFDIYALIPKILDNNKILTIFCNQNAFCCENYSIGHDNIEIYLLYLNSTIILWNYKGYGLRKGMTTFRAIDKDINILSQYIKQHYKDYKIIIHGCSIGGYSSIKLAKKLSDMDNIILIADRTFGDINKIVLSLKYGKQLNILYSLLFPKFSFNSNNVDDYISIPGSKKVICFDAKDEIIKYNSASLIFNLTKKYYNDIVKPKLVKYKEYKALIESPLNLSDELNQLIKEFEQKDFDENFKTFIQHLIKYINSIEEFFMFFIIFGYPFNPTKEITYDKKTFNYQFLDIPIVFMNLVKRYKTIISNKLMELIQIFNYLFIKINLKTEINDNDIIRFNYVSIDKDIFHFGDNFVTQLHQYFGFVHRIFCGHNGKLKNNDIAFIKGFLQYNKFLT